MWSAGLDEAQAGIKIARRNINKISGRNINNLRYADDTTLMAEREEELKSLLMKVKEESEKAGLTLSIQKIGGFFTSWATREAPLAWGLLGWKPFLSPHKSLALLWDGWVEPSLVH